MITALFPNLPLKNARSYTVLSLAIRAILIVIDAQ